MKSGIFAIVALGTVLLSAPASADEAARPGPASRDEAVADAKEPLDGARDPARTQVAEEPTEVRSAAREYIRESR